MDDGQAEERNTIEYHGGSELWRRAQCGELKFWLGKLRDIPRTGKLDQDFRVYAHANMEKIMKIHDPPGRMELMDAKVLEVGSGPIPFIIDWPTAKKRIAIDPLFSMYRVFTRFKLNEKNLGVWCYPIKAENFKYWKDDKFDIIICSNVLDHCDNPDIVLKMMLEHLDLDGAIYLDVFLREPGLEVVHPHGWKDINELAGFMNPILGEHFTSEYLRTAIDNKQTRLYMKLVYK